MDPDPGFSRDRCELGTERSEPGANLLPLTIQAGQDFLLRGDGGDDRLPGLAAGTRSRLHRARFPEVLVQRLSRLVAAFITRPSDPENPWVLAVCGRGGFRQITYTYDEV